MERAARTRVLRDARNVHHGWFALKAHAAEGEVVRIGGVSVSHVPGPSGSATLAFPGIGNPDISPVLDEILAWCRERQPLGEIGCWSGGASPSRALAAGLLARGFGWGWQPHWMGLDLSQLHEDHPAPAGLTFQANPPLSVWHLHDHPEYGPSRPEGAEGQEGLAQLKHLATATAISANRLWHVVAWLEERPVGAAVVLRVGSVAGVFDVAVLPDARGQGVGKAVTLEALRIARQQGCTRSALNATPLGGPVYRKLGFSSAGYGQTWWLPRHVLAGPAPEHLQVAFLEAVGMADLKTLEMFTSLTPAQLDTAFSNGFRPLDIAAQLRQPRSARWLLAHGATLDVTVACVLGWRARVPSLLAHRPDLANLRTGADQATPLHRACAAGDLELITWLLGAGADPTFTDGCYHATPAKWARHLGQHQAADLLESR